jgi:hypothetical protein
MSQSATKPNPESRDANLQVSDNRDTGPETPMFAVWLALAAIVLAGLYGIRLGLDAKKPKATEPSTSLLWLDVSPTHSSDSVGIHT